jgi:hypothetical protein
MSLSAVQSPAGLAMDTAREDAEKVSFSLLHFLPFLSTFTHAAISWFLTSYLPLQWWRLQDAQEELEMVVKYTRGKPVNVKVNLLLCS